MSDQLENFEIEDVRVLELLNNPMRLRLLYQLREPSSVRDLADRLGVPVTRLYYHLNMLEEVGLVEVVETRKRGALLQKIYRAVATSFAPVRGLIEETDDRERMLKAAVGAVLDGARADATAGLMDHFERVDQGDTLSKGTMGRTIAFISEENARQFSQRIAGLVEEMAEAESGAGVGYAFSFVFFPMAGPGFGDGL